MSFKLNRSSSIVTEQNLIHQKNQKHKIEELVNSLEEKIFFMQICDDPAELNNVETLIQQFTFNKALLGSLTSSNEENIPS